MRRIGLGLLAGLLLVLLTSCGGGSASAATGRLELIVSVIPDGGADVRLKEPDGTGATDLSVQDLFTALVDAVFKQRPEVTVQGGDGYQLARAHVSGVFHPGAHPVIRFDGTGLRAVLVAHSVPDLWLRLELPAVPAQVTTDASGQRQSGVIDWESARGRPWAQVRLEPRPGRWLVQMLVSLVCFGSLAAALVLHERVRLMAGLAALATLTGCAAGLLALTVRADDAGVAGVVGRHGLLPAALLPPLAFVAGIAALIMLVRIVRRRPAADGERAAVRS